MKKNLAKRIVLGLLTGAVLMSSSVAWAGHIVEGQSYWGGYEVVDGVEQNVKILGAGSSAVGKNSVAVGYNSASNGDYSIAIGANLMGQGSFTSASGEGSIAIGKNAEASAPNNTKGSIAIGAESKVDAAQGIALGFKAECTMLNSVALGAGSVANNSDVVSVGHGGAGSIGSKYRKIVNVENGSISADSHDAVTGGQLYESYGLGKEYFNTNGSTLIQGKNLTEAVVALDEAVNNITTPDLDSYATKTELNNKANASDVYTKTEADATFVKIENNKISNNGNITFDVGDDETNIVTISTTGITVGSTSTHIDGKGVYVGAHNFEDAKAALNDDGKLKAAGGKFEVGTKGEIKAANGSFKVDADGNVTAESVTAGNIYTKEEIDQKLGGSNASVAGLSQRLDKTNAKINKVGAGAAALAALHPLEYDPDDKLTFSAGMGNYAGENAAALGAFYRPNEKFMVSLGGTMGNGENMVNLGLSIGLDKPNGYAKLSKRELIQKVNAMEAKYEAVEAEKEAMKAEMAEMKAMLQAILSKK
ncbi:MAG: YadA-like family protein [Phascolarctobacterium sp.]|nr:YadA-like family protein [Phascolarctobacterium sp.]